MRDPRFKVSLSINNHTYLFKLGEMVCERSAWSSHVLPEHSNHTDFRDSVIDLVNSTSHIKKSLEACGMAKPCPSRATQPPLRKWGTDPGSSSTPLHHIWFQSGYETIRVADTSHTRDPRRNTTGCVCLHNLCQGTPSHLCHGKVCTPTKTGSSWALVFSPGITGQPKKEKLHGIRMAHPRWNCAVAMDTSHGWGGLTWEIHSVSYWLMVHGKIF